MELRPLGRSGLWVGRLGLGTMTWGRGTDEYEARDQLAAFLDAGVLRRVPPSAARLELTLDLGGGLQLSLVRG